MADREPIAFMSYVRADDCHESGNITRFRERLEGEVQMQTGKAFPIFQDRNDIKWGQQWKSRINETLSNVTFLIPVITPSFFESPPCRSEFETFLLRENMVGVPRLILPFYYVQCDQLEATFPSGQDSIADVLRQRNWTDWRPFRFKLFTDPEAAAAVAGLAQTIKLSIRELDEITKAAQKSTMTPVVVETKQLVEVKEQSVEGKFEDVVVKTDDAYELPEARPVGEFDKKHFAAVTSSYSYYAYTRRFDETVRAADLADDSELLRLYEYLARRSADIEDSHKDIGNALTDIVSKRTTPLSLSVTLLLDNSGSARGRPITAVAQTALVLSEWLSRWGVRVEVLGFTTRAWKGGQSRESWLADGKPSAPGRLNDVRHIIYKVFDESVLASSPNFGLMIREGLLKENIDAEALLWAHHRIKQESTLNKYIFILSDGAPVDDSTLSVNPGNFLERHLIDTISWIEQQEDVNLFAVGVGHDQARYYPHTAAVTDLNVLGLPVFEALRPALRSE
jgi:cobaltochelatase CobT